jgi:cytochrome c oxidase subunit 2
VRIWSLLFAVVAIACVGAFLYAPFAAEWWLPAGPGDAPFGRSPSAAGRQIDTLFVIILAITGAIFVGTQVALVWATYRYRDLGPDVRPARYFHGSQRLEVLWTVIPAGILVFLTVYQMGTWASVKFRSEKPRVPPLAEVTGRQFQWAIRYPGPDGRLNTADDLHTVNDLHFVKDKTALIHLKSSDVVHSFFLPALRIKQDAMPGLTIPVWFDADRAGHYELVCAELCGWGHYKMRGNVTVHEDQRSFDEWMDGALKEQSRDQVAAVASGARGGDER